MPATFVVETGSVVTGANAYITTAEADQFNDDGIASSSWTAANAAAKEKAIRLATAYLDAKYNGRWQGYKVRPSIQPLNWPRYDVEHEGEIRSYTVIPPELKKATFLMALEALATPTLMPSQSTPGSLIAERSKVGELEVEKQYMGARSNETKYPEVDRVISPLLQSGQDLRRS